MALKTNTFAAATAIAAALSLLATPVEARERWHRRDRDHVDAGDVIAGVLLLGGIAAIASAANKNRREREERYPVPPPEPRYSTPGSYQRYDSGGMDRAVDMCVAEVEQRSGRVGSVDGANRNGQGWQVSGGLANGEAWSCWIGNDGRVSDVDVSDGTAYADPADGELRDQDDGIL